MDFMTASSFAAPVIGGLFGKSSAKDAQKAAIAAAQEANKFTKEMMQSRHQWEVADLKAAGLNPVLSAGAAPSMGSSAKSDVINPMDSIVQGANSAMQAQRLREEIQSIRADVKLKNASAYNQRQQGAAAGALAQGYNFDNSAKAVKSNLWSNLSAPVKNVSNLFGQAFDKEKGWISNLGKLHNGVSKWVHKKTFD